MTQEPMSAQPRKNRATVQMYSCMRPSTIVISGIGRGIGKGPNQRERGKRKATRRLPSQRVHPTRKTRLCHSPQHGACDACACVSSCPHAPPRSAANPERGADSHPRLSTARRERRALRRSSPVWPTRGPSATPPAARAIAWQWFIVAAYQSKPAPHQVVQGFAAEAPAPGAA